MFLQLPNGIDPRGFQDGVNSPDLFVYGNAPNRGLRAGKRVCVVCWVAEGEPKDARLPAVGLYFSFMNGERLEFTTE